MRYSYAVEQAIRAASILHAGQVRKSLIPYPYITHLFAVAMIVSDYTDDEDTIVAALLQDTQNSTGYTAEEMEEDFGRSVKDMVLSITEPDGDVGRARGLSAEQKTFLNNLKNASESALIVLAAKKIHVMRTVIEEYCDNMGAFIAVFGADQDSPLFFYQGISNALNRKLQSAILAEFNDVFTEYKNFIHEVKHKHEARQ